LKTEFDFLHVLLMSSSHPVIPDPVTRLLHFYFSSLGTIVCISIVSFRM